MNDSNILTDREKLVQLETRVSILETDSARLKDELAVYQAATITANKKLDQMLMAIIGNDELKIRGLMQRFETLEGIVDIFQQWRRVQCGALAATRARAPRRACGAVCGR